MTLATNFSQRLALIAAIALLFFAGVGPLPDPFSAPQTAHLILTMGAFPLIIGAMIYFTPTLTRSSPPSGWIGWLPVPAFIAGGAAFMAVSHDFNLIYIAAPLGIMVCSGLLYWMQSRSAASLGGPHPGLAWYQAALLFLIAGLVAIIAARSAPEWWWQLRNVHRTANLMGFLGLTTIGTLQVFLPTVGRYPDPETGLRLKRHLKIAVAGSVLAMAGAAEIPYCDLAGRLVWLYPLLALAWSPWHNRERMNRPSGAILPLLAALWGFIGLVISGEVANLPYLFTFFLFPLVTGAMSHLLPLWWWPGMPTPRRDQAQALLGRCGILLVVGFYGAGVAAALEAEYWRWITMGTLAAFAGLLITARFKASGETPA